MKLPLVLMIALTACGHSKPSAAPPAHPQQGEMTGATPELTKFHDTLAPRWHAAKGPERMAATCSAIVDFAAGADAIAAGTPPAKADAARWRHEADELREAVAMLRTACDARQVDKFDTAFAAVHEEFHELLELATGEHEGDHEDHDEHQADAAHGKATGH